MIPILYEANETSFTTQGLGRLSDATSCVVTEVLNGLYELEMEYPIDGIHVSDISLTRIIYAEPADGKEPQPFSIYGIDQPMDGVFTVYAEHISYQLSFVPVMPFTAASFAAALNGLVTNAAEACPFTVWTDISATGATFEVSVPTRFRSLLAGNENALVETFGVGEYEFDKYVVKAHSRRGADRGVTLRYGKNITDINQEQNIQNTITGICPYWQDHSTGTVVTLPEKVLWSTNASNYPYKRTIPMDFTSSFEDQPTVSELRTVAQAYIDDNDLGVPDVNITLSFVPLWQSEEYADIANLERVYLGDTINVEFEKLDVSAQAKVVKTVYDVLLGRYRSIQVGSIFTTIEQTIHNTQAFTRESIKDSQSMLQAYIDYITEKITGGKGGYIVFNYNATGLPEEMLIMNTQSEETATRIIRLNQNGIAFSTDGGTTYKTGWAIDGVFCADFIGAGTFDANLVRAGILQDVLGTNYWNMETGEFRLAANTKVGASGTTDTISSLIDAKVETWAQSTNPATAWTTNAVRQKHDGDLWLYTGMSSITVGSVTIKPQGVYQYDYNNGSPVWSAYSSTSDNLFDLADGKSTIYYGTYRTGSASSYTPNSTAKALAVGDFRYYGGYTYICTDASTPTWTRFTDAEAGDYLVDSYTGCTYKWTGSAWSKQTDYASAIDDAVDDYDDTLTQQKIFNRLTNNGVTQGIYLSSGKLYINATYIGTGTMTSITIRNGTPTNGVYPFSVDASGNMYASSATIKGTFICGPNPSKSSSGGYWTELDSSGTIKGGYGSTQYGYIDYSADSYDVSDPSIRYKGIQIQAGSASQRGILRISTHKISVYAGYDTSQTATYGATGTMRVVYKEDSSNYYYYDYDFINGLLVSTPHTS